MSLVPNYRVPNLFVALVAIGTALTSGFTISTETQAAIVEISRWHLGETGSIVSGLPQDSVNTDGNYNHSLAFGAGNTVQTAGLAAGSGSTAYLQVGGAHPNAGAWGNDPIQTLPADNYGLEVWAKTSSYVATNSWAPVMTLGYIGGYQIALTGFSGNHWGAARNGQAWITNADSPPVELDTWYNLALIRESGVTQFYVDGVAIGPSTTVNINLDYSQVSLGMQPGSGDPTFNGGLDEARIFVFNEGGFSTNDLFVNNLVPEPSTWALLTISAIGLCLIIRRRKTLSTK